MALCGHPAHGAYGGIQPGRNEQATLAVAPTRSPVHPCSHAKAQHLGHPSIPGLPKECFKRSRSPPGRRHALTPQDATRGHHPGWVPPLARTEAPSDRSPRGETKAALTPQGCKGARRNGMRRQGTLAAPGAPDARRLPQHGESSSDRVWTEAMEVPTTSTPNGHHLPLIPDAGPTGPAPNGRTFPPFPRQPSKSDRQRFTGTPTGQQTERPGCPPVSPRVGGQPAARGTARLGHTAKRTSGQPRACPSGGGTIHPTPPPPASGAR